MNAIGRVLLGVAITGIAFTGAEAQGGAAIRSVTPDRFALGDEVTFTVANLERLCPDRGPDQELRLFLDGFAMPGIVPQHLGPDRVRFDLEPSWMQGAAADSGHNPWAHLASGSLFGPGTRRVKASLGYESCPGVAWPRTNEVALTLSVLTPFWRWTWIGIMLLIAGLTVWLARTTPLLREGGAAGPYSLGRTQIAFWTVLALGAFLLILISTGAAANLNGDVLALLGISAATGLGSAVVDGGKEAQVRRREALESEQARLNDPQTVAKVSDQAVLEQQRKVAAELAQTTAIKRQSAKTFFSDLLQDENGYSVYRLQFVLWTLVLGGYFVYAVVTRLTMPTFSDQLLVLLGLSSGTYVSLKTQERQV